MHKTMQMDIKYIYNTWKIASTKLMFFLYSLKKNVSMMDDAFKSSVYFNYGN